MIDRQICIILVKRIKLRKSPWKRKTSTSNSTITSKSYICAMGGNIIWLL